MIDVLWDDKVNVFGFDFFVVGYVMYVIVVCYGIWVFNG